MTFCTVGTIVAKRSVRMPFATVEVPKTQLASSVQLANPDSIAAIARAIPHGKFFRVGDQRFLVKGVTYGTFAPDGTGYQLPPLECVERDFALMSSYGINTVRVYTEPSRELLDCAAAHGLRVMVGLPWAQHVAFLDDADLQRGIRRDIRAAVQRLGDHPAVLLFALGNEIPASIVRWHGRERIQQFLREVYDEAKAAAPDCTLSYVNYPPTEYLDLPFLDVHAFNVYLHDEGNLRRYIARLQLIAGNKPLLLAEAGADSIRHGEDEQAALTSMQLRASFAEGAAGAIAFAWTDEWWRGGYEIDDWAFGLVDKARRPKRALAAVTKLFAEAPFSQETQAQWPKVSVVICAYNAASTLEDCLSSLDCLTYPNFEVVIVNDGSKDATGDIARRHPSMRLIEVPNGGLSRARNLGLAEATGDIVAYTDADVRVEPDWLTYLVQPFLTRGVVACGGPNVVPADDPWLARAVALSPGGPTHVMLDDHIAEHVPGCNFAVRREALLAIGGFNPIYLRAGDDVDVCWRLQARGWKIGFSPSALVWHHHRPSIKAFWRQQVGYGEGEAWLRPHHPDKFVGRKAVWRGRIYSALPFVQSLSRTRIDAGVWGTAAFPSVYHPGAHPLTMMPHAAGWLAISVALLMAGLIVVAIQGWGLAGGLSASLGAFGLLTTFAKCVRHACATDTRQLPLLPGRSPRISHAVVRAVIAWLHFVQPLAREAGWFRGRFAAAEEVASQPAPAAAQPRTRPVVSDLRLALNAIIGRSIDIRYWGETWTSCETLLTSALRQLRGLRLAGHIAVDDGWQLDRDISLPVGAWAWLDLRGVVEDHGSNKRLLRVRHRVRLTPLGIVAIALILAAVWSTIVVREGMGIEGVVLLLVTVAIASLRGLSQLSRTIGASQQAWARAADDAEMAPVPVRPPAATISAAVECQRQRPSDVLI
jgi:GT2 family glycosyltransferase